MAISTHFQRYANWLHTQWPAGRVEKLPLVKDDFSTNIAGVYVVGDLTGVPLLKFSADSGARAVDSLCQDNSFVGRQPDGEVYDVVIIGGGVSGYSAALQAKKKNLNFVLLEAAEDFSTIKNFPAKKPIYTYPEDMDPQGEFRFCGDENTKEKLFESLKDKIEAENISSTKLNVSHIEKNGRKLLVICADGQNFEGHRVIVAIGKSGNFRRLDVAGEDNPKVINRLHDPKDYRSKQVAVIGGGDSALESTISIAKAQQADAPEENEKGSLTLICRGDSFPRAKEPNVEAILKLESEGRVEVLRSTVVESIEDSTLSVKNTVTNESSILENNAILSLIGREAPLDFFRRSGIAIKGESTPLGWLFFAAFFLFTIFLYDWKNFGVLNSLWSLSAFPDNTPSLLSGINEWWRQAVADRSTILGTLAVSMKSRSFYYTLLYTSCIGMFGYLRVRRRKTVYVKIQTWSLFLIQLIPLFLLPELLLPLLGYNGFYDSGLGKLVADNLFPSYISATDLAAQNWPEWGHPRAYWHAYGLILAWPLNVYNVFTPTPIAGWLIISFVQTFILIPALIYKYGKGAYCGWICSCGGLAETLGDTERHKMPHGPFWNKLGFLGQFLLLVAFVLLALRIVGWVFPESWANIHFDLLLKGENQEYQLANLLSWKWSVDILLGGILGVGLYFKYSARIWCRFACPLAALMNIYARFSKFRIFAEKAKCISCNQCTSMCHQGIDVMAFANKGKPMEDPQCVRCSACVQVCPTGVLQFGQIDKKTGEPEKFDRLEASKINMVNLS